MDNVRKYVILSYSRRAGNQVTVLGESKGYSPEDAIDNAMGSVDVEPDIGKTAAQAGYVAVAKSNWNAFREI